MTRQMMRSNTLYAALSKSAYSPRSSDLLGMRLENKLHRRNGLMMSLFVVQAHHLRDITEYRLSDLHKLSNTYAYCLYGLRRGRTSQDGFLLSRSVLFEFKSSPEVDLRGLAYEKCQSLWRLCPIEICRRKGACLCAATDAISHHVELWYIL